MVIARKLIVNPRKVRDCEAAYCTQHMRRIEGPQLRLYGSAERHDPKYAIYLHPECEGKE